MQRVLTQHILVRPLGVTFSVAVNTCLMLNTGHKRSADCNLTHRTQTTSPQHFPWAFNIGTKWVYIVVNGKPGASHTDAKGCLVQRYLKPTAVTKRRYLTPWEWEPVQFPSTDCTVTSPSFALYHLVVRIQCFTLRSCWFSLFHHQEKPILLHMFLLSIALTGNLGLSNVNFHMAKRAAVAVLRHCAATAPITMCNLAAGGQWANLAGEHILPI